jgi:hypothetical protein
MVPNRSSAGGGKEGGKAGGRKQIFVVPVGPWIGYHRVADAVDVPSSIKEAEAMMKAGGGGGGAGGGKGGKKKDEEEEGGEEKLTRRQLLERFLTKSRGILDEGGKGGGKGGKGGKKKSSSAGQRGIKGVKMEGEEEEGGGKGGGGGGGRGGGLGGADGDIGDDLAQNADSRELIGLGSDNEVGCLPSLPPSLPPFFPSSLLPSLSLSDFGVFLRPLLMSFLSKGCRRPSKAR